MALSICMTTPDGLAAKPQSMAHHTLCTRTLPFSTDTSATSATMLPKEFWMAMPRPRPGGGPCRQLLWEYCGDIPVVLANLTGIPAISVPVGLSTDGLPIALQLQAAWGHDGLLLDAAEALERANGRRWVESLPPLARAEPTEA